MTGEGCTTDPYKVPDDLDVPLKKRGRFIPCRGGGTDTTYYTDWHEVDEETRAISIQGGRCNAGNGVGITFRDTDETPTVTYATVASRLIYLS